MQFVFFNIYLVILFLATIFGVYVSFKNGWKNQQFLSSFLVLSFCLEVFIKIVYTYDDVINLNYLYKYYLLLSVIFFYFYFKNKKEKQALWVANGIVFLFLLVFSYSVYKNFWYLNSYVYIAYSLAIVFLSLIWFYTKILNPNLEPIWDDPKYYIAIACMALSVFLILRIVPRYLFLEFDKEFFELSVNIYLSIASIYYLLFIIAEYKYLKRGRKKISKKAL